MRRVILFILVAGVLFGGAVHAGGPVSPFHVNKACGDGETWDIAPSVREKWEGLFASVPDDEDGALEKYFEAVRRWRNTPTDPNRLAAEYWIWRSLYQMNLYTLARSGFRRMIQTKSSGAMDGIKLAAIACLNRIDAVYPSLELASNEADVILKFPTHGISSEDREEILHARFSIILKRITETSSGAARLDIEPLRVAGGERRENGDLWRLAEVLVELKTGDRSPQEMARKIEGLLAKKAGLSVEVSEREEFLRLTLARLHYERGAYDEAIKQFSTIKKESPRFGEALSDLAWAYLMKRDYEKAVGIAYNVQVSGLDGVFLPDAPIVAAIAFFERCHYYEVTQSSQYYQKKYGESYRWLRALDQKLKANPQNLYKLALDYFKTSRGIPKHIAKRWLNSPVFASSQRQLNQILDENDLLKNMLKKVIAEAGRDPHRAQGVTYARQLIPYYQSELARIETRFVKRINENFTQQSAFMLAKLENLAETAQLLEAEVYNVATGSMLGKANPTPASPSNTQAAQTAARGVDRKPAWIWGTKPVGEVGGDETWRDELGLFKAELTDQCSSQGGSK